MGTFPASLLTLQDVSCTWTMCSRAGSDVIISLVVCISISQMLMPLKEDWAPIMEPKHCNTLPWLLFIWLDCICCPLKWINIKIKCCNAGTLLGEKTSAFFGGRVLIPCNKNNFWRLAWCDVTKVWCSMPSSQHDLVGDSISVSTTLTPSCRPILLIYFNSCTCDMLTSETWHIHSHPWRARLGHLEEKLAPCRPLPTPKNQTLLYTHGCCKSMTGSQNGGRTFAVPVSHWPPSVFSALFSPMTSHTLYEAPAGLWMPGDCQLAVFPEAPLPLLGVTHNLYTPITVPLRVLHSPYILSTSTCSLLLLFPFLILSSYWTSASPAPPFSPRRPQLLSPSAAFLLSPLSLSLHPPTSPFSRAGPLSPTSRLKNWLRENGQLSDSPCAPTWARSHALHTTAQIR